MKKLLLTESQTKLLMEEIDKNDSIQKLLFNCDNISLLYNEDNNGEINKQCFECPPGFVPGRLK